MIFISNEDLSIKVKSGVAIVSYVAGVSQKVGVDETNLGGY
jgi:hypothetical protein